MRPRSSEPLALAGASAPALDAGDGVVPLGEPVDRASHLESQAPTVRTLTRVDGRYDCGDRIDDSVAGVHARDRLLRRDVTLTPLGEHSDVTEAQVRLAALVRHRAMAQVLDANLDPAAPLRYVVTEAPRGGRLTRNHDLSQDERQRLTSELTGLLAHLHDRGIGCRLLTGPSIVRVHGCAPDSGCAGVTVGFAGLYPLPPFRDEDTADRAAWSRAIDRRELELLLRPRATSEGGRGRRRQPRHRA